MVSQTGILSRTQPGYTPLVTLLMPPRVKMCLDAAGALCSVNGNLTPPPPTVTSANTTDGRISAGTYQVVVTYDLVGGGESAPSSAGSVAAVSSNSQNSSITMIRRRRRDLERPAGTPMSLRQRGPLHSSREWQHGRH